MATQARDLRERVEGSGSGLLTQAKRIDGIVLALEDTYERQLALGFALKALANVVASFAEDEQRELLNAAIAFLLDEASEEEQMIRRAADAIRRLNPEALDSFLRRRDAERHSEPWISTDRSPRRVRVELEDGGFAPGQRVVSRDRQLADAVKAREARRTKEQR